VAYSFSLRFVLTAARKQATTVRQAIERRKQEYKMTGLTERAIFAGGCFWGMQDLLRRYPGVLSTRVGYTGGDVPNATYRHHGTHAEAMTREPATVPLSSIPAKNRKGWQKRPLQMLIPQGFGLAR
jgi:Peptide methionine sulfoxide reductase